MHLKRTCTGPLTCHYKPVHVEGMLIVEGGRSTFQSLLIPSDEVQGVALSSLGFPLRATTHRPGYCEMENTDLVLRLHQHQVMILGCEK